MKTGLHMARAPKLKRIGIGHNGGPPLREKRREKRHVPEWGTGGFKSYFPWRKAYRGVWKSTPREIMIRRDDKAEALGLTYEEYTLELLERGTYLQAEDGETIAAIKARRKGRKRV